MHLWQMWQRMDLFKCGKEWDDMDRIGCKPGPLVLTQYVIPLNTFSTLLLNINTLESNPYKPTQARIEGWLLTRCCTYP